MFKRPVSIVFVIYVIIGIVVAWTRSYITIGLLKGVLSALLAIFLWFLPLLGVSHQFIGGSGLRRAGAQGLLDE